MDEAHCAITPDGARDPTTKPPERLTARVVLPDVDHEADSEEELVEEGFIAEEEGDALEGYPDDTEDLELVHARIGSLDSLRLPRFAAHLKRLCLRQNFVSHLDPEVFCLLTELEELDLYDNKVKAVGPALNNLSKLSVLDLSFNLLRTVPDTLEHLTSLKEIYFVQNRISKITGFGLASTLRSLELGGNKIRKIENLDALVNLEELYLGKNKIAQLENLGSLKKLKILALQSNRITLLDGIEALENLEELYLSHNGVRKLEGLEHNLKLKTLDLGSNFVQAIENVSHLTSLEELWLSGNAIPNLHALEPQLGSIKTLQTLYLEANPCQMTDMAGYRRKIMLALPQLQQIDATFVKLS